MTGIFSDFNISRSSNNWSRGCKLSVDSGFSSAEYPSLPQTCRLLPVWYTFSPQSSEVNDDNLKSGGRISSDTWWKERIVSQPPKCRSLHASLGNGSEKENTFIKCCSLPSIVLGTVSVTYLCVGVCVGVDARTHTLSAHVVTPSKPANMAKLLSLHMAMSVLGGSDGDQGSSSWLAISWGSPPHPTKTPGCSSLGLSQEKGEPQEEKEGG